MACPGWMAESAGRLVCHLVSDSPCDERCLKMVDRLRIYESIVAFVVKDWFGFSTGFVGKQYYDNNQVRWIKSKWFSLSIQCIHVSVKSFKRIRSYPGVLRRLQHSHPLHLGTLLPSIVGKYIILQFNFYCPLRSAGPSCNTHLPCSIHVSRTEHK